MNDSSAETDRYQKQKYLKDQILDDPDYDADEFVDFMRKAKENCDGADIDNWTNEELIVRVNEFKKLKREEKCIFFIV